MEPNRFSCLHPGCNASYRRKEHLVRHSARHSQTRTFTCPDCGVNFDRTDTLRRHTKIHRKPNESVAPRVTRACDRCHAQKSKCDGASPCGICARKGLRCSFNRGDESKNLGRTQVSPPVENHTVNRHEGSEPARKRTRRHERDQENEPSLPQVHSVIPDPSFSGLSTISAREIRAVLLQRESVLQEDAAKSAEQELPTQPTSQLGDLFVPSPEDESLFPGDEYLIPSFARTLDVDHYVCLYFVHFHPFWPFIMKLSFTPRKEPRILVLAIMMIGLWITGENRLRKLAWTIHGHLHVMIKRQMSRWSLRPRGSDAFSNIQGLDPSPNTRWPMATYQAILLFTIFAMTAHDPEEVFEDSLSNDQTEENPSNDEDDVLERIRPIFNHLVRTCRAQGVFYYPAMVAQGSVEDPYLYAWTNLEELKYFALSLYKASTLFTSLTMDNCGGGGGGSNDLEQDESPSSASVSLSDLQFPVPDNGYLWFAPGGREFFRRREMQLRDPVKIERSRYTRDCGPWISDIVCGKAKVWPAHRRRAWMSLGPFLGYIAGVDIQSWAK